MERKINRIKKSLQEMKPKVIEVTKTNYTLDNGDVYEHTFDIDEDITVEEFQALLDNARETIIGALDRINGKG
jgi:hypothetical protein